MANKMSQKKNVSNTILKGIPDKKSAAVSAGPAYSSTVTQTAHSKNEVIRYVGTEGDRIDVTNLIGWQLF